MNVKKQIFKGTLYAVVAGCMWGISGIFGQLFFRDYHGSPLWITSTRLTIAGIILLVMSYSRDHKRFFDVWKSKKNMPTLFLYVLVEFSLFSIFIMLPFNCLTVPRRQFYNIQHPFLLCFIYSFSKDKCQNLNRSYLSF